MNISRRDSIFLRKILFFEIIFKKKPISKILQIIYNKYFFNLNIYHRVNTPEKPCFEHWGGGHLTAHGVQK
jgi:hypothetical protein